LYPPIDGTNLTNVAHGDEKRFVVQADEKLTAFLGLESTVRARSELP